MNVNSLSAALVKASDEQNGGTQHGPAALRVYAGLRAQIISLDLLPDTVLARNELAEFFDVSQSPVREAINRLEQEGLVLSYPQSKTIVTRIDVEHARETQFLRVSVELEVARSLAEAGDPQRLAPARRILRMQKMAGEDGDIGEFTTLDRLFHMSLFETAGVPALWHVIASRSGQIDRLRRLNLPDPGKMTAVVEHHEAIINAISEGDRAAIELAVRQHLSGTLSAVPQILEQYPEYF